MPAAKASRFTRNKTRYRGISYRLGADGSRRYAVYFKGNYVAVAGGEAEAIAKQGELKGKAFRGETAILPTKATLTEVAEAWYEGKARRLAASTAIQYRDALDRILLPRLGTKRLSSITVDDIVSVIRELEGKALAAQRLTATYCLSPEPSPMPCGGDSSQAIPFPY